MLAPSFLAIHARSVEYACMFTIQARKHAVPASLLDAMQYSLMAGGKRIRPALLMTCFEACGGQNVDLVLPAAVSIECMHTYSLIHDDLPCMDNDDLRRGSPTCHKKFDESTAILAADALQALSFELLTDLETSAHQRIELIKSMAIASGCRGMVGGQMMDILAENQNIDNVLDVERIHLHKTGELLRWSCEAGALLADASDKQFEGCSRYGKAVGLLFQIADDILDATATTAALGKSAGKDAAQSKATYVSVLGIARAREMAEEMYQMAFDACDELHGEGGEHLRSLATYILKRGQ